MSVLIQGPLEISRQIFERCFTKIRLVEAELFHTDGQTDVTLFAILRTRLLLLLLFLNLLFRLTPVLPGVRTRELCSDFLSSVFSVCLGCVFPLVDYLWRSSQGDNPLFFPHVRPTLFSGL